MADQRIPLLVNWLNQIPQKLGIKIDTLAPASSDASFRRYFRITAASGTLVVMDAPPPKEDCRPFVDIAERLAAAGLNVPKIIEKDLEQGFLLLSDLGPTTYYEKIQQGVEDSTLQKMYREALAALVRMQMTNHQGLPRYDAPRLKEELGLFTEWYTTVHCKTTLTPETLQSLDTVFDLLVKHNAAQPQVFVHRDFHSPT